MSETEYTFPAETEKKTTVNMMSAYQCEAARKAVPAEATVGFQTNNSRASEYGPLKVLTSTGRATCRCCGKKIAKGEDCIEVVVDLSKDGCGSFTASAVKIHRSGC